MISLSLRILKSNTVAMAYYPTAFGSCSPDPETAFVYCLRLPFQCDVKYSNPEVLFPAYCVVEVGTCPSEKLAHHLYDIMDDFTAAGAREQWFSSLERDDQDMDAVMKGKFEDKICFIQKCCKLNIPENTVDRIRESISHGITGRLTDSFQHQFIQSLGKKKQRYSKAKWNLVREDLMKGIQQGNYRSPLWPDTSAILTGELFSQQMYSNCTQQYNGPDLELPRHTVEITLPQSKEFHFSHDMPKWIPQKRKAEFEMEPKMC